MLDQASISNSGSLDKISQRIHYFSSGKDIAGLLSLADSLEKLISLKQSDLLMEAGLFYYAGVCNLLSSRYENAAFHLAESVRLKDSLNIADNQYLKALFNLGVAHNYLGNYTMVKRYLTRYIEISVEYYGADSPDVASAYATLIGTSILNNDYKSFIEYTDRALGILKAFQERELCDLYSSIGAGYARMGDCAKAMIYFEQAESVWEKNDMEMDQNYITLINSMAINYGYLGMNEKEEEYFRKGIELAVKDNSIHSFNMIHTYAIALANAGNIRKGESLLTELLERSGSYYGTDSRYYIEALKNYAAYLLNYRNDAAAAIKHFSVCNDYLSRHPEDANLRDPVYEGYARALHYNGQSREALAKIQELLFYGSKAGQSPGSLANPVIDSVQADRRYVRILRSKYEILTDIFSQTQDIGILRAVAATSHHIIDAVDKIRLNISEEESRIVLGDHYRKSYLMAIRDSELCYRLSQDPSYLEKTFQIAEKSKVAGLLATTRELNAIQLHIPPEIADYEQSLQREIGMLNSKISLEKGKAKPNKILLAEWNEKILVAIRARDSLILTFEKYYPEYFALKYNTVAPLMKEIPSIVGKKINYVSYIVADSLLYIFVVNSRHRELVSCRIDSMLFKTLGEFRDLLSNPALAKDAGSAFRNYQEAGTDLYKMLVEPVRKYFISRNLLISPDNYLSYLPFETILSSKYKGEGILYRKLDYLMNDFDISYAYSATLMKEIGTRNLPEKNSLAAFAPFYGTDINLDSLFLHNQQGRGYLYDLPYARQEAEFVASISRGKLFLNEKAKESVFKKEALNYNIVHLAMHTLLNDQYPMNSAMIFSQANDSPEDGLLYTSEIYGIPLRSKMVVLSSCNTGTGVLSSGEGILSLARGFLYSGSRSVVMSMWEIEDKSGTEIVSRFYENLKKGHTKSKSLRKSRTAYLKNATQLKSHPYFWATLIVYGDNSPIYPPVRLIAIILILTVLSATALTFYFRKRKYS
ncbi:MAG: CHAT domain-containing protein [Bacteroidales bacterium]|nr:CHAT domain-containing protein [Bacteroidales bacterium]